MRFIAEYEYKDANNKTVYTIRRTEDKQFIPKTPTGSTTLDGIERIPYKLPELNAATTTGETIFVCNGEKATDLLTSLGLTATCSAGGERWQWTPRWANYFIGAPRVYVLADNDEIGKEAAKIRARIIHTVVDDVRIVELPNLTHKQDVYDYLQYFTVDDLWRECEYAPKYRFIKEQVETNYEEAIIAYLFRERTESPLIFRSVSENDFYDAFWKACFIQLKHYTDLGLKPDPPAISLKIKGLGPQKEVEDQLWKLYETNYNFDAIETWIKTLLEESTKRSIEKSIIKIADAIKEGITGPELIEVWNQAGTYIRKGITVSEPPPNVFDFVNASTSVNWLLPDFMEEKDRMILVAPEGAGKAVLLRQVAVRAAAGIGIWDETVRTEPVRCLMLDRENSPNQIRNTLRRNFDEANKLVGANWYDNLVINAQPSAINLLEESSRQWFEQQLVVNRPQLVFCLPIYKMFMSEGENSEVNAQKFCKIIDDYRERYNVAFIFEAHAPTGSGDNRTRQMRPFGSSVWARWPELGWGLQTVATGKPNSFDLVRFRGDRNGDLVKGPKVLSWNNRPTGWSWIIE